MEPRRSVGCSKKNKKGKERERGERGERGEKGAERGERTEREQRGNVGKTDLSARNIPYSSGQQMTAMDVERIMWICRVG